MNAAMQPDGSCDASRMGAALANVAETLVAARRNEPPPLPTPDIVDNYAELVKCAVVASRQATDVVMIGPRVWRSVLSRDVAAPMLELFRRRAERGGEPVVIGGPGAIDAEKCKRVFRESVCRVLARLATN